LVISDTDKQAIITFSQRGIFLNSSEILRSCVKRYTIIVYAKLC